MERSPVAVVIVTYQSEQVIAGCLDSLPEGTALIIAPSNAIHTFFMRFSIDVAFLSRSGELLKLRHNMPPWRMAAAWRGFAVVEMSSGAFDRAGVRPGDRLRIASRETTTSSPTV